MIRAVLFDLDGVIRRFDVEALTEIERRHGLAHRAILTALLHPARLEDAVTGRTTDEGWRESTALEIGSAGPDFLAWEGASGRVDEAVLDLVRRVRQKVPVGLLTNATSRLGADLKRLGLDDAFDLVVNTSEIGVAKPDPQAFAHAAAALGFEPSAILFVDDTPRNVETAARLGFATHQFTGTDGLAGVLESQGLLERVPAYTHDVTAAASHTLERRDERRPGPSGYHRAAEGGAGRRGRAVRRGGAA